MSLLEVGIVTAQVPDRHQVVVQTRTSGIAFSLACHVGKPYADAVRIRQDPLPGLGTMGIILIPYGNLLNATWITAILQSGMDAINYAGDPTDPNMRYEALFSGHWELLDGKGNQATQWADGSSLTVAATSVLPTPNRHIVDSSQQRQSAAFPMSQRVPAPPSPFQINYQGAEGLDFQTDGSGNATLTANKLTLIIAGKTYTFDSNGITANADIKTSGSVVAGNGGGDQVTLQTHKHPTAATGAPSAPTPGT